LWSDLPPEMLPLGESPLQPTSTSSPGPIPLDPPLGKGEEKRKQRGYAPLHAPRPSPRRCGRGKPRVSPIETRRPHRRRGTACRALVPPPPKGRDESRLYNLPTGEGEYNPLPRRERMKEMVRTTCGCRVADPTPGRRLVGMGLPNRPVLRRRLPPCRPALPVGHSPS
jgi:hypothetical protein